MAKNTITGLATGIGSLPHTDAEVALDLVFKYTPQIPFWPQLPKRDGREGMMAQFSEGLPCLEIGAAGLVFNPENKEEELEKFYERLIAGDLDYFRINQDFARGLYDFKDRLKKIDIKQIKRIKCHITGPFSFAASINDEKGKALLHDPVFMQIITKGLAMKARWQIKFLEEFGRIIIFIDEPYLACFGSAYTPINRGDVIGVLTELTEEIIKPGSVEAGIHCCGNTDWSIFTDINSLDIINFDAFGFLDRLILYADNLKAFLKRGGILCWGIVPTTEFSTDITADLLIDKINSGINFLIKKGIDKELLTNNLLLSPACGLGALGIEKSEKIFKLLTETKNKLFDKLV